jgi:hypothetical protein
MDNDEFEVSSIFGIVGRDSRQAKANQGGEVSMKLYMKLMGKNENQRQTQGVLRYDRCSLEALLKSEARFNI